MKKNTARRTNSIIIKETRQYTCSRRRNKEGKKIWVVLEDGRKFYRIFRNRSLAISYFKKLKTIYAQMLVQDLKEHIFSSIVYTKLETTKRGLVESLQSFDGGIVEDSDKLFDEEIYLNDSSSDEEVINKLSHDKDQLINKKQEIDFSFVDDLFPKPQPLISPFKITIRQNDNKVSLNKKIISFKDEIKIYQSDLDLNLYVLGKEGYEEHAKENSLENLQEANN